MVVVDWRQQLQEDWIWRCFLSVEISHNLCNDDTQDSSLHATNVSKPGSCFATSFTTPYLLRLLRTCYRRCLDLVSSIEQRVMHDLPSEDQQTPKLAERLACMSSRMHDLIQWYTYTAISLDGELARDSGAKHQ